MPRQGGCCCSPVQSYAPNFLLSQGNVNRAIEVVDGCRGLRRPRCLTYPALCVSPTPLRKYPTFCLWQFDAWMNMRGHLDKVQMGVATPDQLRGTYAAANAPTEQPPPPPPRGLVDVPPPPPPRREMAGPAERPDGLRGASAMGAAKAGALRAARATTP